MILPMMIEVAAQKPIFLAREELVDMNGEDNKKSRILRQAQEQDFNSFRSPKESFGHSWLQPESPRPSTSSGRGHTSRPDINFSRKD